MPENCSKVDIKHLVKVCTTNPINTDELQRAVDKIESWKDAVTAGLPETTINIGMIKQIQDMPEFREFTVKGNYRRPAEFNITQFGSSKEDIVIYPDSAIPRARAMAVVPLLEDEELSEQVRAMRLDDSLDDSDSTSSKAGLAELKMELEVKHKYQLLGESIKVAGEMLLYNISAGRAIDQVIVYGLLVDVKTNKAKPYRIEFYFNEANYTLYEGDHAIDFNVCLKRVHNLIKPL